MRGGGGRISPGSNVADIGDGMSLQIRPSTVLIAGRIVGGGPRGVVGAISFCGLPGRSMSGTTTLRPTPDTILGRLLFVLR